MKLSIVNAAGNEVGTVDVLAAWETRRVVPALLQQVVVAAAANRRIPWAHTKGRGDVRGGGRKPWRQKGTGRARHGSIRSPLWRGGGVTFGPTKEETFAKRVPSTMKRVALGMALTAKTRDVEIRLLDAFPSSQKTKDMAALVRTLGLNGSVVFVPTGAQAAALARASRNLPRTRVISAASLTAADVLAVRHVIATPESFAVLEGRLSDSRRARTASSKP